MDERALGVDEEHVRDPDLLDQTRVKGATLVAAGGEGQAVVLPVMPQVQRHGEVLEMGERETRNQGRRAVRRGRQRHVPCSLRICCRCSPPGRRCPREEPNLQKVTLGQTSASPCESSVCTSAGDYACVNPAVEL